MSLILVPETFAAKRGKINESPVAVNVIELDEVQMIGSRENIKEIAGSAAYIDVEEMRSQNQTDINRILRKVPGVSVRQEDGFGLFPNISLRGVDSARSAKVTIMEDGILTAPAPYSAASAYYSPNAGRMSSVEVLKGSSQVKYGPHITGGAINFNSTLIPESEEYYLKAGFGSFNEILNHMYFGNTFETDYGNIGFVVENWHRENQGFRTNLLLDEGSTTRRSATNHIVDDPDTGFRQTEQMVKLMWEPKSSMYQRFEVKFGHTNLQNNDGYLGLPEATFRKHPFGRLDGGRHDVINTEHFRTYLRHQIEFDNDTNLVTTAYGNHFSRNWHKLHSCESGNGVTQSGKSLGECLLTPEGFSLLNGTGAGRLDIRNNNRDYYLYGVQTNLNHHLVTGELDHQINFGVRYHSDQIRRYQWEEEITQNANGGIDSVNVGARGSNSNRVQQTTAIATHLSDTIKFGNLTVTPGIRYEHLFQETFDYNAMNPEPQFDDFGVWAGGLGVNYALFDVPENHLNLFASVHRGFSTPSPRANIRSNLSPETSVGIEAGVRHSNDVAALSFEGIFFRTEFDDLIIFDSIGGAGSGDDLNLGEITTQGIELLVRYDPGVHNNWVFQNPWTFSFTYTDAEFGTVLPSGDTESFFAGAVEGNAVPYVPEIQFNIGTGIEYGKFAFYLDGQYVDETYASGNNSAAEFNPASGKADARFGKTDDFFILDASMSYQIHKNLKLFTSFKNITNNEYLVTRQPQGPRPGMPFSMMGGVEISIF